MKRTALINDISGLGKCSLVADISVMTAMGIEACPFPTAVLNAQTGYAGYSCIDLTGSMRAYTDEWRAMGESFDGILTGFLLSAAQAEEVLCFTEAFHRGNTLLLVDPVMADGGETYANFSPALLERMKILADRADIITPNVSELCLLADEEMEKCLSHSGYDLKEELRSLAKGLVGDSDKTVIVTGVPDKVSRIGNLIVTRDSCEMIPFPAEGGSFSGTGDLFAAAVLGGVLKGREMTEAVRTAGEFVRCSVRDAAVRGADAKAGTDYERNLRILS